MISLHRSGRVIGAMMIAALLTGARLPLLTARPIVIPATANPPLRTEFTVKVGGTVVASRFMAWDQAGLDGTAKVSIDRFSQDFDTRTILRGVSATIQSGKRTGLRAEAYFCGPEQRTQSELGYQLFGSVIGNVENFIRFCLADEDGDRRFDHVFLGGAKSAELQLARKIDPLPFHKLDLQPDDQGRELRLVLMRIEPGKNNLLFYARPYAGSKAVEWGDFSLWNAKTGVESKQKGKINVRYGPGNTANMPNVMGYDIMVKSVDIARQEVTFTSSRASEPSFYQNTEAQYNMMFIYI